MIFFILVLKRFKKECIKNKKDGRVMSIISQSEDNRESFL